MNDKKKLKIGDKVSRICGCTYSWNDHGVITKITRKRWVPDYPAEDIAEIKNLSGEFVEIELDNLEKL